MSFTGLFLVDAGVIIREGKTSEAEPMLSSSESGSAKDVLTVPSGMVWNVGSAATKGWEAL